MPQVLKEDVRKAIMETALRLFAENGYKKTSIAMIAKESTYSVGNIYNYFKNKKALFDELILFFVRLMREKVGYHRDMQDVESFENFIKDKFRISVEYPYHIVILTRREDNPYYSLYEEYLENIIENFYHFVQKKADQIPKYEIESVKILIYNIIQTLAEISLSFPNNEERREAVSIIEKYHLAGVETLMKKYLDQ